MSWYLFLLLCHVTQLLAQEAPITSTINPTSVVNSTPASESNIMDLSAVKDITNTTPLSTTSSGISSTTVSVITFSSTEPNKLPENLNTATENLKQGDVNSLPLWELIYPDQNSTITDDTTSALFIDHTVTQISAKLNVPENISVAKYFKVDDVVNCEKYFGDCLRQVLANVMPKLRNGDAALHLPPIDPFYLNRTSFLYNGGPLNGHITVGHAIVYGLTSMKYRKVLYKPVVGNNFKLRLSSLIPNLQAKGSYKADLKLNSVNVRPKGDFNFTLQNVAIELLSTGVIYERDGHKFLNLNTMNATASVRDAKLNATGLIPDSRLNDIILNVTNQYWREIFNILLPETRENWMPVIRNALNGALAMVPFDFLKKI